MKNFIDKTLATLKKSILDKFGKESSVRISGYIVLFVIVLYAITFLGIEITNAIMLWQKGQPYIISTQTITLFLSIISYHLGILFNKRREYNPTTESIDKKPSVTDKKDEVKEEDKG